MEKVLDVDFVIIHYLFYVLIKANNNLHNTLKE